MTTVTVDAEAQAVGVGGSGALTVESSIGLGAFIVPRLNTKLCSFSLYGHHSFVERWWA
jgi:hypothetical protein